MENKLRITATDAIVVEMHIESFGTAYNATTHCSLRRFIIATMTVQLWDELIISNVKRWKKNTMTRYDFFCFHFVSLERKRERICLKGEYRNVSGPNLVWETDPTKHCRRKKKRAIRIEIFNCDFVRRSRTFQTWFNAAEQFAFTFKWMPIDV